ERDSQGNIISSLSTPAVPLRDSRFPTFDSGSEFSITSNPSGTWSYGSMTILGGTFTGYTDATPNATGISGLNIWNFGGLLEPPYLIGNFSGREINTFGFNLRPLELDMHPSTTRYGVTRWTAPLSGTYSILGAFRGINNGTPAGTTSDVHI